MCVRKINPNLHAFINQNSYATCCPHMGSKDTMFRVLVVHTSQDSVVQSCAGRGRGRSGVCLREMGIYTLGHSDSVVLGEAKKPVF